LNRLKRSQPQIWLRNRAAICRTYDTKFRDTHNRARTFCTRSPVNAFVRLIEIYVLIHSRIGGNGKQRSARDPHIDDGRRWREDVRAGREEDQREGWTRVRGQVISFLCLLLIYSDASRLSASNANKFLEPSRQLRTLSRTVFSPHVRTSSHTHTHTPLFYPLLSARSTAATRYRDRLSNSLSSMWRLRESGLQTCRVTARGDFAIDPIIVIIIARVLQRTFDSNCGITPAMRELITALSGLSIFSEWHSREIISTQEIDFHYFKWKSISKEDNEGRYVGRE